MEPACRFCRSVSSVCRLFVFVGQDSLRKGGEREAVSCRHLPCQPVLLFAATQKVQFKIAAFRIGAFVDAFPRLAPSRFEYPACLYGRLLFHIVCCFLFTSFSFHPGNYPDRTFHSTHLASPSEAGYPIARVLHLDSGRLLARLRLPALTITSTLKQALPIAPARSRPPT